MQSKSKGLICVYSLKNPTYPEFICKSSCAILCIDINPSHSHMIAAGLIDGNVAVYNLQIKSQHPFYVSDARNGKHQNVVNQVIIWNIVLISSFELLKYDTTQAQQKTHSTI